MRVIRKWSYDLKTKPPFSEMPELVHRFMEKHGLTNRAFLYYFDDYIFDHSPTNKTREQQIASSGCARAIKACPSFGQPRFFRNSTTSETMFLSNIDSEGGCTEEELLPLMKQIHKRWGCCTSKLYFYDMDFFGDVIPLERNSERQVCGSGISIMRHSWGEQEIIFSIDILHNGAVLDPAPYVKTMKELLPKRRDYEYINIFFTEEEEREHAELRKTAEPLVQECKKWLRHGVDTVPMGFSQSTPEYNVKSIISSAVEQNTVPSFGEYKMAPALKAIAKRYGFSYRFVAGGNFILSRKDSRGHSLVVIADSGPSHFSASFSLSFEGLGFRHDLLPMEFFPGNQAEFDACAERAFSIAVSFMDEALDSLSQHYPDTPDWYQPFFSY